MDMQNCRPRSAPPKYYLFRTDDGHYSAVAAHLLASMRPVHSLGEPVLNRQPIDEAMAVTFIRKRDGTLIR